MSAITVFRNSPAKISRELFHLDDDAIALIECDDSYDEKALSIVGEDDLKDFAKKSKEFKFFCEITAK